MKIRQFLIPVGIILVSVLVTGALVRSRPAVEAEVPEPLAPLVRVIHANTTDLTLDVTTQGTVLPRTETTLVAQVAGTVVGVSSSFEVGGFFSRGEVLVSLDRRDYELSVRRAESQVSQAELQLIREQAEAAVAAEEWQSLGDGGQPSPLTLRKPQVAQAKAAVAAAQADLEKARLDLERTRIRAPFDGRVRGKQADRGQFLVPGTPIAGIYATDYVEVRLPVPDDQLGFLDLPFAFRDQPKGNQGPTATLAASFGRRRHAWEGTIVRSEGELDPRTRMLNLVARVENPYARSAEAAKDRPPLAVGLFVEARIQGESRSDVIVVPREALRGDNRVLVVDEESRLRFRPVQVVRVVEDAAIIGGGLKVGEQVCVSPLDVVSDGMKVRVAEEAPTHDLPRDEVPS